MAFGVGRLQKIYRCATAAAFHLTRKGAMPAFYRDHRKIDDASMPAFTRGLGFPEA